MKNDNNPIYLVYMHELILSSVWDIVYRVLLNTYNVIEKNYPNVNLWTNEWGQHDPKRLVAYFVSSAVH